MLKNEDSDWIYCPELQLGKLELSSWVHWREFRIEQFVGSEDKQYFTFTKVIGQGICEVKSAKEIVALHISNPEGQALIRHDAEAKMFEVTQFLHGKMLWRVYHVSEDSSNVETREPEKKPIPKFMQPEWWELGYQSYLVLAVMINEAAKFTNQQDYQQDPDKIWHTFAKLRHTWKNWEVKEYYPFFLITNILQPTKIFIAWKENSEVHRVCLDISEIGRLFNVPVETNGN